MKKIFAVGIMLFSLSACCTRNSTKQEQAVLTSVTEISVDDLLNSPDQYVDKTVRATGLVTHVCRHSGKRLHLTSAASGQFIRVEAKGNIGRFDKNLEGNKMEVSGTVHRQVYDKAYLAKWESEIGKGEGMGTGLHEENNENGEESLVAEIRRQLEKSGKDQITQYWIDGENYASISTED
jgi:hypothetical protein